MCYKRWNLTYALPIYIVIYIYIYIYISKGLCLSTLPPTVLNTHMRVWLLLLLKKSKFKSFMRPRFHGCNNTPIVMQSKNWLDAQTSDYGPYFMNAAIFSKQQYLCVSLSQYWIKISVNHSELIDETQYSFGLLVCYTYVGSSRCGTFQ